MRKIYNMMLYKKPSSFRSCFQATVRRIEQFLVGVVNYRLLRQYSSLGLELTPEGGVNTITVHPEGSS